MVKRFELEKINASNVGRLRLSEMEYTLVGNYNVWEAAKILAGKGTLYDKMKKAEPYINTADKVAQKMDKYAPNRWALERETSAVKQLVSNFSKYGKDLEPIADNLVKAGASLLIPPKHGKDVVVEQACRYFSAAVKASQESNQSLPRQAGWVASDIRDYAKEQIGFAVNVYSNGIALLREKRLMEDTPRNQGKAGSFVGSFNDFFKGKKQEEKGRLDYINRIASTLRTVGIANKTFERYTQKEISGLKKLREEFEQHQRNILAEKPKKKGN